MHVAAEYCKLHRRVMSSTPGMGCDGGKQNEETTKADTPREFVQTFASAQPHTSCNVADA
jgi:hypothetical protein